MPTGGGDGHGGGDEHGHAGEDEQADEHGHAGEDAHAEEPTGGIQGDGIAGRPIIAQGRARLWRFPLSDPFGKLVQLYRRA